MGKDKEEKEEKYMKAYKFEIFPNKLQKEFLNSQFRGVRLLYNKMLEQILPAYKAWEDARKEFRSYPRNQEKDSKGNYVHKFTAEEQTEFFYSLPENQAKDKNGEYVKKFTPIEKPPITRNGLGSTKSPFTTIAQYRETLTDANGVKFLKDLDSIGLNYAATQIESAFKSYENPNIPNAGLPRFKSVNSKQSYKTTRAVSSKEDKFNLMNGSIKLDIDKGYILLPKFNSVWAKYGEKPGWVKVKVHRDVRIQDNPCYISNVTVSYTPEGKYYVSLLVYYQKNPFDRLEKTNKEVGVSYALANNAYVIADDDKVAYKYNASMDKLARIDKHIEDLENKRSRMKGPDKDSNGNFIPPSNNYKKMTLRINKLHAKKSRMIAYAQHNITKELIKDYDILYIRDMGAKDFIERKKAENPDMTNDDVAYLNKQVTRLAPGNFQIMLNYKAKVYDKEIYMIDKYYPCSQTCSNCGEEVKDRGSMEDNTWVCPYCHHKHIRYENSAKNILQTGKSLLVSPEEYKDNIQSQKKLRETKVAKVKDRIYNVIKDYNTAHADSILRINKGKVNSIARVIEVKNEDISDSDIIQMIKDMTSSSKRSKIAQ